jgi:hypothetical protein
MSTTTHALGDALSTLLPLDRGTASTAEANVLIVLRASVRGAGRRQEPPP